MDVLKINDDDDDDDGFLFIVFKPKLNLKFAHFF